MGLDAFIQAAELVLTWEVLLWLVLGILVGIIFGALPGIGPAIGIAVSLPLTLPLPREPALILLLGIYSGGMYGGSIAAILINTPGTPAAAATTFDGYPMSRKGKAVEALSTAASASAFGGFLTTVILLLITPLLITLVLAFGTPEYFLLALFGLALITVISRGSIVKGIIAGSFGLLLSTIGTSSLRAQPRYTLGSPLLYDGVSFVVVLIGVFAISEIIKLAEEEGTIVREDFDLESGNRFIGITETLSNKFMFIKSAVLGMGIGSIPGAGATISTFIAYSEALRTSEQSESFGEGITEGVIASEAANNGTVAGSIVPTVAFGIPGSATTAVFLGGLLMHGVRPGPELFTTQIHLVYSLFLSLFLGNIVILLFGLLFVTKLEYITRLDVKYIIPSITVLATLGSFALRQNWLDVFVLYAFGVIGYYMQRYNYSVIALVLGVVLGSLAEENLYRSLQISGGSVDIFFTKPLSLLILLATVAVIILPLVQQVRN